MNIFTAPALVLLLMIVGFGCYYGWLCDRQRHLDQMRETARLDEHDALVEAEAEAQELASAGIYDWRQSGL